MLVNSEADTRAIDVVIIGLNIKISIKDLSTGAELASIVLTPNNAGVHRDHVAKAILNIQEILNECPK